MTDDLLIPDNLQLSRVRIEACEAVAASLDDWMRSDKPSGILLRVADLIENSVSANTRRAYQSDLAQLEAWGTRVPATPSMIASYLAVHADTLSVATLVRRVATISKAHEAKGLPNPCRSEIVRATLRAIKRTRGVAQKEAKPLLREDLFRVLDAVGEGVKDTRDRALLLLGFAGGFRRSEIVGLDCDDIEHVRQRHASGTKVSNLKMGRKKLDKKR